MIHMGPAIMDVATHMIELANECHTPVLVTPSVMTADVPLHFWKKVDYLAMNLAQAAAISCLSGENAKTARISASILFPTKYDRASLYTWTEPECWLRKKVL